MDEPSKELILNLLHQEAQQEIESRKGKQKAGVLSDWELALSEWTSELRQCSQDLQDHRMARSVAKAVYDDSVALAVAVQEECRALADRITALRLGGQLQLAQSQPQQLLAAEATREANKMLESSYLTFQQAESMSADAQSCAMLALLLSNTSKLVEDSLIGESLSPPRCCRMPTLLSPVRGYLGQGLARQYEEKGMEHEDSHRTYCSNAACATYLMPFQVQGYIGTCKNCRQQTCTLCIRQAHPCAQCRNFVELGTGCNHITCRCRYEFCYVCGTKWKKLLLRAQHVAGRDQVEPPAPAEVQRVAQDLLERHKCDHESCWKRINRGQVCEECHEYLSAFILECRQCHLRACVRCKLNRL
ncbi:Rcat domain-containing protein [Aspergillus ibericus CBS 121593]|uniref:RING-type domain-containing protein n=1 Tax=Aspergillus ibericus CBS 121593 TaxID=1448316 RepID=A0A395H7Q0_9EURO|nr:hypothetical protein BO80DRAFT_453623 [Aspergillus ibericus CBS 121593]RAL02908.1 hypothetical protein BO80DRAFT_453623 [Aspergillus ibericus CBS 121593]